MLRLTWLAAPASTTVTVPSGAGSMHRNFPANVAYTRAGTPVNGREWPAAQAPLPRVFGVHGIDLKRG
jgi:hypothetical protein